MTMTTPRTSSVMTTTPMRKSKVSTTTTRAATMTSRRRWRRQILAFCRIKNFFEKSRPESFSFEELQVNDWQRFLRLVTRKWTMTVTIAFVSDVYSSQVWCGFVFIVCSVRLGLLTFLNPRKRSIDQKAVHYLGLNSECRDPNPRRLKSTNAEPTKLMTDFLRHL